MFHETTIDGLEYYAKNGYPDWQKTANFFRLIRDWWKIVNAKSPMLGKLKRDSTRNPISEEDPGGIQYLKKFLAWLEKWEKIYNIPHGLSKETFLTCKQTTHGLIGLPI